MNTIAPYNTLAKKDTKYTKSINNKINETRADKTKIPLNTDKPSPPPPTQKPSPQLTRQSHCKNNPDTV